MGNELFMRTLPFCEICIVYSKSTAAYLRNAPSKICRNMSFFIHFLICNTTLTSYSGFFFLQFGKVILIWTLHGYVFKPPEAFQLKSLSNTLLNLFKNMSCDYLAAQWEITDLSCILSREELLFAKCLIPPFLTVWLKNKIWPRLINNCLLWAIHL